MQAAQKLVEAANMLAAVPEAMQLRYLSTLQDIASERSSTIVFPLPINMLQSFMSGMGSMGGGGGPHPADFPPPPPPPSPASQQR